MSTSRSKIVSWFECPRLRYLRHHFLGKGVQRVGTKAPTNAGLLIHEGAASLLLGEGIEGVVTGIVSKLTDTFPKGIPHASILLEEQKAFVEGTLRALNRCRLQELRSGGSIIAVEQEKLVTLAPGFDMHFRADWIQQTEDGIVVGDFKPASQGDYGFVRRWERNHQVLAYAACAEKLYKQPVLGIRIEGYVKGKRKFDKRLFNGEVKIQDSPLCYVYENSYSGAISPEYQRGSEWVKVPLWSTSITSQEYIEELLTKEQVERLFLAPVPPISPNRARIESWQAQTVANERRCEGSAQYVELIRVHRPEDFQDAMDRRFPQNMDTCYRYGSDYPCEMEDICFNSEVACDVLASGLYEERRDHHGEE